MEITNLGAPVTQVGKFIWHSDVGYCNRLVRIDVNQVRSRYVVTTFYKPLFNVKRYPAMLVFMLWSRKRLFMFHLCKRPFLMVIASALEIS
jgi:hypothetical protein